MICKVPNNWVYDESLEMLFLFYQCTDELLSEVSPDSYSLPMHNAITLLGEIESTYSLLVENGLLSEYYLKYIPPIIEEFLSKTEEDYILKRLFGFRLQSIRTGLAEALKSSAHLEAWIDTIRQICTIRTYREEYEEEIVRLVTRTKDKTKLLYCTSNYFITLRWIGYSREHLYTATKRFFANDSKQINQLQQIKDFIMLFPCKEKRFDFLILMDVYSIEYMDSISDNLRLSKQIKTVDVNEERNILIKDYAASEMLKEYDSRIHSSGVHEKMAIVRFYNDDFDPYSAAIKFTEYISFLQTFSRYFKHFYYSKQVYRILLKMGENHYREIKTPNKLQKRPFVSQEVIDSRIRDILNAKSMSFDAFTSIAGAIEMHAEAFDSRSTAALLKTFWTALETLFSSPNPNSTRSNVIYSVLPIIQKTYLLKKLRTLYALTVEATESKALSELGIHDFPSFVEYYSSFKENAPEMKKIYSLLSNNPLLRSRLYSTRAAISNGKSISKMLESHNARIEWQLKRLYRIRNISTHLGASVSDIEIAANHLHNYFDFIVNYMLCKSENGDYIISTSTVVFEAKNDLRIYQEYLKENNELSKDNYKEMLFGADQRLLNYRFEF